MRHAFAFLFLATVAIAAEPEFPLTADSKPQPDVPKGTMIKDSYTAKEGSVFPGTQREYQIYLPAGHDKAKPAAFMVFQDGVIYQAPVVFDNLIAKKDIPPLVGIFIKPGVVPAANDNALPRFNRSFEYDSITPTYSQFLIDEFLPAIEAKHGIQLSTDPNHAAISGNSSGGICAFMVAWHRPDRFRRVFTGVGTYVGIHGADQLSVRVRKFEPKPLRVFLQSGTGDNNLYCGDWWMANQMMERSLTWAGYDVNHAWGEGGHNAKHASQIFPDVLRWLWRDWQTNIEVKANPKGESKWRGYEVVGVGEWETAASITKDLPEYVRDRRSSWEYLTANKEGIVFVGESSVGSIITIGLNGKTSFHAGALPGLKGMAVAPDGEVLVCGHRYNETDGFMAYFELLKNGERTKTSAELPHSCLLQPLQPCFRHDGVCYVVGETVIDSKVPEEDAIGPGIFKFVEGGQHLPFKEIQESHVLEYPQRMALSPDQTLIYVIDNFSPYVTAIHIRDDGTLSDIQRFAHLYEAPAEHNLGLNIPHSLCVDTNGWLYVATSIGIQVCDQAGRVNFIIPTPEQPYDVCFGGKDLSELFIACGDTIYKRPTKAKGVVSGQQAPIKPPPPKL